MSGRVRLMRAARGPGLRLAMLLAMSLVWGCGPAVERPGAARLEAAQASQAAPAYHRPSAWWRAQHSAQLGGAGSLWPWARPAHGLGECLVCHRPASSCDPCHAYVGAPAMGGGGR
jgi:hypothetical protein